VPCRRTRSSRTRWSTTWLSSRRARHGDPFSWGWTRERSPPRGTSRREIALAPNWTRSGLCARSWSEENASLEPAYSGELNCPVINCERFCSLSDTISFYSRPVSSSTATSPRSVSPLCREKHERDGRNIFFFSHACGRPSKSFTCTRKTLFPRWVYRIFYSLSKLIRYSV